MQRTMMRKWMILSAASCLMPTIVGCTIGYKKALFFTKTNFGLDIDSEPPTMELTFSRREAVVAPTFENGQTPPVLASFVFHVKGPLDFSANISSTFAGGDAAVTIAGLYSASDGQAAAKFSNNANPFDSTLRLTEEPSYRDFLGLGKRRLLAPGEIEPFIFATDTSFGLKVAWSGATAQFPDTIKIGFNRKEFALAPVTIREIAKETDGTRFLVRMPSFLAMVDNSAKLRLASAGDVKHVQYFATGKAADQLARHYEMRKAMFSRLDPRAKFNSAKYGSECESDQNQIASLISDPTNAAKLLEYLMAQGKVDDPSKTALWIFDENTSCTDLRAAIWHLEN